MRLLGPLLFVLAGLSGCASVPNESVLVSQQVEKNLKTLKENNLALLKVWRDLSVDYWSEKVAREGPDMILDKARKAGTVIDMTKDYRDLVARVMNEFRVNFMTKIDEAYMQTAAKIEKDFDQTEDAQQRLTSMLQSVVKLDAERDRIFRASVKELGLEDKFAKVQQDLKSAWK